MTYTTTLFRVSTSAALLAAITAFTRVEGGGTRANFTLTGGAHAGSYTLTSAALCDVRDVRGRPPEISGHFVPERTGKGGGTLAAALDGFYLYTDKRATDKPDILAVGATFKAPRGRKLIEYKVYTMPPALQEPGLEMEREGRGTVTVRRTGTGAIATFSGVTKDGVRIEGTMECGG